MGCVQVITGQMTLPPLLCSLNQIFGISFFIWHSEQQHESIQLYLTYSVYNSQLEDTLKNTSCLPRPGFEPGTSSCGTRKKSFFA